jgi:hypothetical protein
MRTKSEVEARIRELVCLELDRRVAEASERLPTRCIYNYRHSLDTRKQIEGEENPEYNRITDKVDLPVVQTIGLCLLNCNDPENWEGTICEDPIDAKKCSDFKPAKIRSDILPDLARDLKDVDWVRTNQSELFVLLWVLMAVQELSVPWWKRVLFFFRRVRLEPVTPKIDTTKLLSPPPEQ